MKSILFPTDFSKPSMKAYAFAQSLAEKMNAQLTVLHVEPISKNLNIQELDIGQEQLHQHPKEQKLFTSFFTPERLNLDLTFSIKKGIIGRVIVDAANALDADVIVMASKSKKNPTEKYLGSVAMHVMEHAKKDVIIVPSNWRYSEVNKIAFASNLISSDLATLISLSNLAANLNVNLVCSHVKCGSHEQEEEHIFRRLQVELKKEGKSPQFIQLLPGPIHQVLSAFVQTNSIDLLAMTACHDPENPLTFPSTSIAVTATSDIPIMIIKN